MHSSLGTAPQRCNLAPPRRWKQRLPFMTSFKDIGVEKRGHVAVVEIRRPPNNFFDAALIGEIATAFETLDADADCRALVLAAQGKAFCAGANFGDGDSDGGELL